MFDFLFQKKNKEMQSMAEIIALDLEKLNLSKLAIEKAVMMIARAIAKSDIIVQTDSKQKSSIEYRLNVMPNDHECGTYFWTRIIRELLWAQEALIIPMNGKYYKASAWQVSNSVLSERIYSNITIECAGEQYGLYKKFMSSEVIHLRYDNAKIRVYLESVVNQYNNTLNAINYMIRLSNQPKFKLKLGAAQSFREKQADGTDKIVTKDMYAEKIKRLLESEDITVMTESEGVSLENIQINASAKAEELAKVALAINNEAANAFDIPEAVFNEDLVNQVVAEAERASHDADFKKQLGLRNLSQEEKKFYEGFKDIKQSITANQIDIIPTEIIDRTLDDVKKASPILNLVNMAPANVKKWIVASHTGAAVWGALTDSVKGELSTEISALNIDLHMLTAYLVIPKAIRELSLEFVDRYFMAILSEAMQDGLVKGYLDGDGKTGPIGIFRQIGTSNSDGTNKAKTVVTNITKFSPKGLSDVRKTLTNNGKRVVDKLYLICNPSDEAEYVDPCMYGEALTGGYVNKSFIDIEKIVDANCPKGKAAFTIAGYYTMGTTGVRVNEYDQTKAMENADLIIASCYANGRAVDDNVAVVFDVTKLEEYVLPVTQATIVKAGQE